MTISAVLRDLKRAYRTGTRRSSRLADRGASALSVRSDFGYRTLAAAQRDAEETL